MSLLVIFSGFLSCKVAMEFMPVLQQRPQGWCPIGQVVGLKLKPKIKYQLKTICNNYITYIDCIIFKAIDNPEGYLDTVNIIIPCFLAKSTHSSSPLCPTVSVTMCTCIAKYLRQFSGEGRGLL